MFLGFSSIFYFLYVVDLGIMVLRDGGIVLYSVHYAFDEMMVKVNFIFCMSFLATAQQCREYAI